MSSNSPGKEPQHFKHCFPIKSECVCSSA